MTPRQYKVALSIIILVGWGIVNAVKESKCSQRGEFGYATVFGLLSPAAMLVAVFLVATEF